MMRKTLLAFALLCQVSILAQTQINAISPTSGPVGTEVTITGSGFNTVPDSNFVYFNDSVRATVTTASTSSLTVIVPTASSNGPIKVVNQNYTDFSDQYFIYPATSNGPAPVVSSFSPAQGQVGDIITINGSNFSTVPSENIVYFGSVKAQVINATSNQISIYVPTGFKYDVISVTVNRQTGYSALPFNVTFPVVDSSFVNSSFSQGVYFNDPRSDSRTFADFDGDGKPDLCSINHEYVSVTRNTSNFDDFSFAPPINMPNKAYISWYTLPVDVDGDGKIDIISNEESSFSVFKNASTPGDISFRPVKKFSTAEIPKKLGDGRCRGCGGNMTYCGTSGYGTDTLADPAQISAGDIDGDGKPDLAVSFYESSSNGFCAIYKNNTTNGLIDFSYVQSLPGTSMFTLIRDIDGDGKSDVIAAVFESNNSYVTVYRNTSASGNISFAPQVNLSIPLGGGNATAMDNRFSLSDINNDGKLDFIISEVAQDRFSVSLNQSSAGNISFASPVYVSTQDSPHSAISDLDGDGKPDVVVYDWAYPDQWNISIYKNTTVGSTVSFETVKRIPAYGGAFNGVKICDVDVDGKPDILVPTGGFTLFRNKANEPNIDSLAYDSTSVPLTTINTNKRTASNFQSVVIKGDRFLGATSVTFNGVAANSFTVDAKDQITAIVDADAAATMKVRVESPLGIATLPIGTINTPVTNSCKDSTISVIFKADNGIPPYKFQYKLNNGAINTVTSGPGDSVVVKIEKAQPGTFTYSLLNITDKYGNGSKNFMNKKVVIKVFAVPPTPASVSGPTNVTVYINSSTGATYTTPFISDMGYNWTVPANATILSGQGSNSIQVTFNTAFCSGGISVKSVLNCGSSALKTLAVSRTAPTIPGTITGPANVCSYMGTSTNATYSIAAVANVNSYNWTVPAGATIVSGQGTTSIAVNYTSAFVSGNIAVQSVAGCTSAFKTLAITKTLAAPVTITGPTGACVYIGSATNANYSTATITGATSYNWTVPTGATIVSGQGTTSISVSYTSSFVPGNIGVQSVSNCGSSAFKTLAITNTPPATPGTITGTASLCNFTGLATTLTYNIVAVANASSYNWTVPTGASIISGQGTIKISVRYPAGYTSGNVSVQAVANCSSSGFKVLPVIISIIASPGTITGQTNACNYIGSATNATYSIADVANASSYNWTVPAGASIISGQGTTSISVSYSSAFVSGNISVQSVATCGSSAFKTLAITNTLPAAPGAITGATNVCSYIGTTTNAAYSITAIAGATSYNWTVPTGATIVSGQGTTSISVSYTSGFVPGNIAVQAVANCGSSTFRTLAITNTSPGTPGTITGTANLCAFTGVATTLTYSIVAVANASSYNWTVPTGASIISGQGTIKISVSYPTGSTSGNVSVQAVANCSNSSFKVLPVTISIAASPGTITGTTNACSYMGSATNAIYSIAAVANASSYNWTVPAGASIVSGQGTRSISVSYTSAFVSGNISVQSVVTCGSSAFKTLAITKTPPAVTGVITGTANVCSYIGTTTNVAYSIAAVAGATSYLWTVPSGATIISGQGTRSISVHYETGFVSGNISVQTVSNCGNSTAKILTINGCAAARDLTDPASEADQNILSVFPNPSSDILNLDINALSDTKILLAVFDVLGKEVINKEYALVKGINSLIIRVEELKPGTYFLKIKNSDASFTKSQVFIKQ